MRTIFSLILLVSATVTSAGENDFPFAPIEDDSALREVLVEHSDLKDPFSAHFRRTEISEVREKDGRIYRIWCGQINAKNSSGGYVGWSDFVVAETPKKPIISIYSEATAPVAKVMVSTICRDSSLVKQP